jgi:hypothetical protein
MNRRKFIKYGSVAAISTIIPLNFKDEIKDVIKNKHNYDLKKLYSFKNGKKFCFDDATNADVLNNTDYIICDFTDYNTTSKINEKTIEEFKEINGINHQKIKFVIYVENTTNYKIIEA